MPPVTPGDASPAASDDVDPALLHLRLEHDEDDDDDMGDAEAEDEAEPDDMDEAIPADEDLWNLPPPRGLREISSLATWTVSTSKPGSGVSSLRAPNPATYWQSDGPQPHLLNIHFFKLVRIVYMRIYVDSLLDESYTPAKMHFLAGTGLHDLREVSTMEFAQPRGWIDVDLSNVGGPPAFPDGQADRDSDDGTSETPSRVAGGTLMCFLVQVRVSENHQNGKDTHLRGLQIFARDDVVKRSAMNKRIPNRPRMSGMRRDMDPDWMAETVLR